MKSKIDFSLKNPLVSTNKFSSECNKAPKKASNSLPLWTLQLSKNYSEQKNHNFIADLQDQKKMASPEIDNIKKSSSNISLNQHCSKETAKQCKVVSQIPEKDKFNDVLNSETISKNINFEKDKTMNNLIESNFDVLKTSEVSNNLYPLEQTTTQNTIKILEINESFSEQTKFDLASKNSSNLENNCLIKEKTIHFSKANAELVNLVVSEVQQNLEKVMLNIQTLDSTFNSKDRSQSRQNRSESLNRIFKKHNEIKFLGVSNKICVSSGGSISNLKNNLPEIDEYKHESIDLLQKNKEQIFSMRGNKFAYTEPANAINFIKRATSNPRLKVESKISSHYKLIYPFNKKGKLQEQGFGKNEPNKKCENDKSLKINRSIDKKLKITKLLEFKKEKKIIKNLVQPIFFQKNIEYDKKRCLTNDKVNKNLEFRKSVKSIPKFDENEKINIDFKQTSANKLDDSEKKPNQIFSKIEEHETFCKKNWKLKVLNKSRKSIPFKQKVSKNVTHVAKALIKKNHVFFQKPEIVLFDDKNKGKFKGNVISGQQSNFFNTTSKVQQIFLNTNNKAMKFETTRFKSSVTCGEYYKKIFPNALKTTIIN